MRVKIVLCILVLSILALSCSNKLAESGAVHRMTITVQYADGKPVQNPKVRVVSPANVRLMRVVESSGELSKQFIFESDGDDGPIDIRAEEPTSFLIGRYMGPVVDQTTIQLKPDTSADIHGFVIDKRGLPVKYAIVEVRDTEISTSTRQDGSFFLPVHKGDGQAVLLTVKNGPCQHIYWSNAGKDPVHLQMDCGSVRPIKSVSLLK